MTTCYMAFANMIDANCKKWRVNISRHATLKEAEDAAIKYAEKYNKMPVKAQYTGAHKYYSIPRDEWNALQYTGTSAKDSSTHTWMTNEGAGCVLLFEGMHFEIV